MRVSNCKKKIKQKPIMWNKSSSLWISNNLTQQFSRTEQPWLVKLPFKWNTWNSVNTCFWPLLSKMLNISLFYVILVVIHISPWVYTSFFSLRLRVGRWRVASSDELQWLAGAETDLHRGFCFKNPGGLVKNFWWDRCLCYTCVIFRPGELTPT